MRYVVLIADGSADRPVAALEGKTPLEALPLPAFAQIAGGQMGLARTVPLGVSPGSDTAILTIFGYDVKTSYTGRAALEAAGADVDLPPGSVALRVNLCSVAGDALETAAMRSHNGGGIEGEEALALMAALAQDPAFQAAAAPLGFQVFPTPTFRHIGLLAHTAPDASFTLAEPHQILGEPILPHLPQGSHAQELRALMAASLACLAAHPVNTARAARGLLPANIIWPWAAGRSMVLEPFPAKYGHHGLVVSAVPLMKGIARLAGLDAPDVPGATGLLETDYEAKVAALLAGLNAGADFGVLHVEAPDECAHAKDVEGKLEAIRRIDARVAQPLLQALPALDPDFRILLLSDHLTLLENGKHDGAPVPFALYDSRRPTTPAHFDEPSAAQGAYVADGRKLMDLLFETP
jgi:2,3-bisphosphoglycerate-independent phosphoglycerate mutase